MSSAVSAPVEIGGRTWAPDALPVRRALAWINKRGGCTAEELEAWDRQHGGRLFETDAGKGLHEWRVQQARLFLNSFRSVVNGMRIRLYKNVPANEETGLVERRYYTGEEISRTMRLRTWAVNDIVRRMKGLASELKFYKLSDVERENILAQVRAEMFE